MSAWWRGVVRLGGGEFVVEREDVLAAAALEAALAVGHVGHVVFERGEQERTELALVGIAPLVAPAFEQEDEEPLDEVLGVVGAEAAPAHEAVKRRPVVAAEFDKRGLSGAGRGLAAVGAVGDHGPTGRRKRRAAGL